MNDEMNMNNEINELNLEELEEVSGGKSAGQKIKATGNVRVRKGPGLDYAEMGIIDKGDTLTFLGEARYDNRGVAWYKVSYTKKTGWVSSRYSTVI